MTSAGKIGTRFIGISCVGRSLVLRSHIVVSKNGSNKNNFSSINSNGSKGGDSMACGCSKDVALAGNVGVPGSEVHHTACAGNNNGKD